MTEEETSAYKRLEATRLEIENWRRSRTKLGPMPAQLWTEAISLARELGISKVATALCMSYGKLSRRLNPSAVAEGRKTEAKTALSKFVEVTPPTRIAPSMQASTVIELMSASGERLTVRVNQNVDIGALVANFQTRP